jgi:hypothetical protein
MERQREIGSVFDLATERWVREIEALPSEPRLLVDRILLAVERDIERAEQGRLQMEGSLRQGLRQRILSGSLAPELTPPWAVKGRRPTEKELDRQVEHALGTHYRRAKESDLVRIGTRAKEKIDAVLAMNRGRSETAEERVQKVERRDVPQMGDPGYAQWREQHKSRGRER